MVHIDYQPQGPCITITTDWAPILRVGEGTEIKNGSGNCQPRGSSITITIMITLIADHEFDYYFINRAFSFVRIM